MKFNKKYNWRMVAVLTLLPLIGFIGTGFYIFFNGVVWQEPVLLLFFWFFSGLGITMGYHRLFAHKSYSTKPFIEWILMILGSLAFENTILKWSSDHRKHHDKAETEDDPYSITEGFWHAHIGWILKNTPEDKNKIRGVKDLEKKSAIRFQNKYYFHIAILVGFVIPFLIGLSYNRPLGALLWAGFLRITLVHHATFFINSLCHYFGKRTYDFNSTARDSWFVSLFTFGEGYHNYHHKFQWDYRNGVTWFSFDPSKWIINTLSIFKLVKNLKKAGENMITESQLQSVKDHLDHVLSRSNKVYKDFYCKKISLLENNANIILLEWNKMEIKYNQILKGSSDINKNILSNMNRRRKEYKKQIREIKSTFSKIIAMIDKECLEPKLAV